MIIRCDLSISHPNKPLSLQVKINDNICFATRTSKKNYSISINIDDSPAQNKLTFVVDGKTDNHTSLDHNNNVLDSAEISIDRVLFAYTDVIELLEKQNNITAYYIHNNNGYSKIKKHNFSKNLCFNGEATIEFETPIYKWLLGIML